MNRLKEVTATTRGALVLLLLFAALFLLPGIGDVQLVDWDENIYAEASRQMMVRGDYLNVVVNGHTFSEKPPFFFWEQVLAYKLFGVNEFAARFPSAVAGIVMILLFYHIGSRLESRPFGLIWGLVYLSSFLPSVFGRVAVIDHTFNLFIAGGAYFLFLFDRSHGKKLSGQNQSSRDWPRLPRHLIYLILASISMGVATLTKGPLGGVIPLVAFVGYKVVYRKPGIRLAHFSTCAIVSLSIGLSWYIINWLKSGESFLTGFIQFQLLLFSKPMEGHQGPFFYHFAVAILGLLPWTAFLIAFKPKRVQADYPAFSPLYPFAFSWVLFVLILFSFVSTKLPHYSASIYIPLSMLVAFNLTYALETHNRVPRLILWISLGFWAALLGLFAAMPAVLNQYAQIQMVEMPSVEMPPVLAMTGGVMLCFIAGTVWFFRHRIVQGILSIAIAMLLFTQGLWQYHLPVFIEIHQKPLLQLVHQAHSYEGRVYFYRMVSFAAFFYGRQSIGVLHNYKFPGDPEVLNRRQQEDLFIICDVKNEKRLLEEHPLTQKVKQIGRFSLFKIEKAAS